MPEVYIASSSGCSYCLYKCYTMSMCNMALKPNRRLETRSPELKRDRPSDAHPVSKPCNMALKLNRLVVESFLSGGRVLVHALRREVGFRGDVRDVLTSSSADLPLFRRDFLDRSFELVEAVVPTGEQLNVDVWCAPQEFLQLLVDDGDVSLPFGRWQ